MGYEHIAAAADYDDDGNNNVIPFVLLSKMDLLYQSPKMTGKLTYKEKRLSEYHCMLITNFIWIVLDCNW
jgi:hypothetical protein